MCAAVSKWRPAVLTIAPVLFRPFNDLSTTMQAAFLKVPNGASYCEHRAEKMNLAPIVPAAHEQRRLRRCRFPLAI
jgi:hypothetical protein